MIVDLLNGGECSAEPALRYGGFEEGDLAPARIQADPDSEGHGEGVLHVAVADTPEHRVIETGECIEEDLTESQRGLSLRRFAIHKGSQNYASGAAEDPREEHLLQHPIDAVGTLINFFEKQNGTGHTWKVRGSHGSSYHAEIAADQSSGGSGMLFPPLKLSAAVPEHFRLHGREGASRSQAPPEPLLGTSAESSGHFCRNHRAGIRNQAHFSHEGQLQRSDIAVADEDLGISFDDRVIQERENAMRSVPASGGKDRLHFPVSKEVVYIRRPLGIASGKITALESEVFSQLDAVAEPFEVCYSTGEVVIRGGGAAGRTNADDIAAVKRSWLDDTHAGSGR